MRIAIIGGGIAGLTAAYEFARLQRGGAALDVSLFESSNRFGGIVETVREGGFTIETGPDAWVSGKPWARQLALDLGIPTEDLIPSNDATRKTHILLNGVLTPMPDGMNMIVPTYLDALSGSPLFTPAAVSAYRAEPARAAELLASIPAHDESIADFTLRHFGPEVLTRVAAPLLAGVFGGDVHTLSVRAVMPAFVAMERTHGSLIAALQSANREPSTAPPAIFTTLRTGLGTLIDRLFAAIPGPWLHANTTVTAIHAATPATRHPTASRWALTFTHAGVVTTDTFDLVLLATPIDSTRNLLTPVVPAATHLLPTESSSAVLVAFAFSNASQLPLPPGFGLLVPPPLVPGTVGSSDGVSQVQQASGNIPRSTLLLACTFTDQKFPHRVPPNGRLIRAFFGGSAAERLIPCNNDEIAAIARAELSRILLPTRPLPTPQITVVRRWPRSLPQYAVGHLDRIAQLESHLAAHPGLTLLGNATHGVGLPDLIHAARTAARRALLTTNH